MADTGYVSIKLRKRLNDIFCKLIISFNKKNTEDENKIKTLTNEEKKLYKSRIVYEKKSNNFFKFNLFMFNKICNLNKHIQTFKKRNYKFFS